MKETRGERWHREAEAHVVRDGLAMAATLLAGWLLVTVAGCASAQAHQVPQDGEPGAEFAYVHDWSEPKVPSGMVRIKQEMDAKTAESASEAPIEQTADSQSDYWDNGAYNGPYDPDLNNNPAYTGGGNSYGNSFYSDGVAYIGGQEFNWYSQNVMPGGGLDELNANGRHVDESTGFVVDGDGYIAVASPWGQDKVGTVIETPFGQGKVYDTNKGDAYDLYTDF